LGRTVLVVDDEEDIRVLARVTLQSAGFRVIEASSGTQALSSVDTEGPDAMLLDIRMPGMDGWEVLDRLRSADLLDDLRVVVFSAHEMSSASERAREAGSAGFLPKPFMPEELVAAVSSAMGEDAPPAEAAATVGILDEAVAANLLPGESVEISSEALARVALQFFHRCSVVLTDRRLLVLKPAWPWGYKVDVAVDRLECRLTKHKKKMDGATLLIIEHGDEVECLFFARRWRTQADALVAAFGGEDPG
jgi:CheY-like chemotaxis protein